MSTTIEQDIQAKGLTAPRVTPADIEANIASEHYFTAADGVLGAYKANGYVCVGTMPNDLNTKALPLLTFCVLVLRNGFTVTGESACASPENFDAEIGRKIARQNAVSKVWPLMGYALREKLHAKSDATGTAASDVRAAQVRDDELIKVFDGDKLIMVTDAVRRLTWDVAKFGNRRMTHAEALDACAELCTGGYSDWRLPTIQELLSLVDYSRHSPAIATEYFPDCKSDWYWSATSYGPESGCAWVVSFDQGYSGLDDRCSANYVRAVRASQS
jgi:hypothetical protein